MTFGWTGAICAGISAVFLAYQRFHFNADAAGLSKQPTRVGGE